MASVTFLAGSGLQFAQQQLQASAHNVANLQTPAFRRQAVQQLLRADRRGVDAITGRHGPKH